MKTIRVLLIIVACLLFMPLVVSAKEEKYVINNAISYKTNIADNVKIMARDSAQCDTLFGDPNDPAKEDPAYWFQYILNIMKYAAIAALVVLSSLDFFKAITEDDKDALKKALNKSVKRLIYSTLIFFLPSIVNFIMSIVGAYGTCGLK